MNIIEMTEPRQHCCPICGYEFDEVKPTGNICPTFHYHHQEFDEDELIADDEDYEWVI